MQLSLWFKMVVRSHWWQLNTVARLQQEITHGKDTEQLKAMLEEKTIRFIELLQTRPDRQNEVIDDLKFRSAYMFLKQGKTFADFLKSSNATAWKKNITIPLTKTASKLLKLGSRFSRGITQSSLPISFVTAHDRNSFADAVAILYKDLSAEMLAWLHLQEDLVICWIAGFKPRGDDSRPDRGLVPLCHMLFGETVHVLAFVYGPGKTEMWKLLEDDPAELMQKNGLWEAILKLSNAVLIDSKSNKALTERGYTRKHWDRKQDFQKPHIKCVNKRPIRYGENDVDSVLHNAIRHLMTECTFESMCNPPGGDWSGISILNKNREIEYRWLTLPRVSGSKTKRPDHVFQFFLQHYECPMILSIESKGMARSVEKGIGPRLEKYLVELFKTPPNVQRHLPSESWRSPDNGKMILDMPQATGVAFLSDDDKEIRRTLNKAKTDIALGLAFDAKGTTCTIRGRASTETGQVILSTIKKALSAQGMYHVIISDYSG